MEITPRIYAMAGALAIGVIAYYLYKHGQLGSPKEMVGEAAKDAKDAVKSAAGK